MKRDTHVEHAVQRGRRVERNYLGKAVYAIILFPTLPRLSSPDLLVLLGSLLTAVYSAQISSLSALHFASIGVGCCKLSGRDRSGVVSKLQRRDAQARNESTVCATSIQEVNLRFHPSYCIPEDAH